MGFTFRVLPHVYLLHQSHTQSPDATRFYTSGGGGGGGGEGGGGLRNRGRGAGPLLLPQGEALPPAAPCPLSSACQQTRILALDARLAELTWKRPFFTGMSSALCRHE